MNKLFLMIALFTSSYLSAQEKKADELYKGFGYQTSIPLYKAELSNKEGSLDQMNLERIANSYRLVHDTENAEKWYAELIQQSDNPKHYLYYAQALQSNGKYAEAKKYFLAYDKSFGADDKRGALLANAIDRAASFNRKDISIENSYRINSDKLEFSPTYYQSGIVFVSNRQADIATAKSNKKDIWLDDNFMSLFYAEKEQDGSMDSPKPFSVNLTTRYHEGPICFSKDGQKIFFTRNNFNNGKKKESAEGVIHLKIYTAEKKGKDWTEVTELPFNTDGFDECHPALSADGTSLIFASNRSGGFGGMDLYQSKLTGNEWSNPENLGPTVNTSGNEVFPFLHDDGTLFFASNGWGGLGGLDIFHTQILEEEQATPTNIGRPINSNKDDFGLILNVLKTEGYFSSARKNGRGKDDIYSFTLDAATFQKKLSTQLTTTVCIYDKNTEERIADAVIKVMKKRKDGTMESLSGKRVMVMQPANGATNYKVKMEQPEPEKVYENTSYRTDENGVIELPLLPNEEYVFLTDKADYQGTQKSFSTEGLSTAKNLSFCIPVEKKSSRCITLKGVAQQKETGNLLPNVAVLLKNNCTGETAAAISNLLGEFSFTCQIVNCDYSLEANKGGFYSVIQQINKEAFTATKEDYIVTLTSTNSENTYSNSTDYSNVPSSTNSTKRADGNYLKIGTSIVLEDIYYDFNDYHILPKAAKALDELAGLMRQYPSLEIELSAHTDSRGAASSNERLSQKRADRAVRYLRAKGISSHRLQPVGYGEHLLRNECSDGVSCSDKKHQYNRRTEIKIIRLDEQEIPANYIEENR